MTSTSSHGTPAESPVEAPASPKLAETGELSSPSIASVHLVEDCADPAPEAKTTEAPSDPSSDPPVGNLPRYDRDEEFTGPCSQSNIQVAFSRGGVSSQKAELKELRLLSAEGKMLATLSARLPTRWRSNKYEAWDGVLALGAAEEVSYKLSVPDWMAVEAALGASTFEAMFVVEVDVVINGVMTTVRSPQVERGRRYNVRT